MQKPTGNGLKAPNRAATNIIFNINSSVENDLEDVKNRKTCRQKPSRFKLLVSVQTASTLQEKQFISLTKTKKTSKNKNHT